MLIYKILFHIAAAIKKVWLKLIYGNAVVFGKGVTWRSHFHLAIEPKAKVEIGEHCFFNHDCSISAMHPFHTPRCVEGRGAGPCHSQKSY